MVVRAVLALVVAVVMTALSLLAVVWMSTSAEPRLPASRAPLLAYEVVAPPPDQAPIAPVPDVLESPSPTLAEATPVPSPRPSPSAVAPGPAAGFAPSAIGGLPMLDAGLDLDVGLPAVPTAASTDEAVDAPARPLSRPQPRYPRAAQREGVQGHVIVRLRVDERGRVTDVVVVEGEPAGVFDDVAVATAKTYRFAPAQRGGRAVATTVQQRIVFRLSR